MKDVVIESSWKEKLVNEFSKEYFQKLSESVRAEYVSKNVYPAPKNVFRAFDLCPFDDVRVVILGQDPYHGEGQANGLSFAVPRDLRLPPSLKNIFKEIESDMGYVPLPDGDLSRWAKQGILLLNSTLTVEKGKAGSHQGIGWEEFTDAVIDTLVRERHNIVYILWGNYARTKGARITRDNNLVIESPHPSPFSAHSGFFGSKPFSRTNAYLREHGLTEIDWH